MQLENELVKQVSKINFDGVNMPVIVIGTNEFQGNNACVEGEIIGRSFFAYDTEVEPLSYWSTRRVLGFMETVSGIQYGMIPQERVAEAREYSRYMPEYPYDGYVQAKDNMIIIKKICTSL